MNPCQHGCLRWVTIPHFVGENLTMHTQVRCSHSCYWLRRSCWTCASFPKQDIKQVPSLARIVRKLVEKLQEEEKTEGQLLLGSNGDWMAEKRIASHKYDDWRKSVKNEQFFFKMKVFCNPALSLSFPIKKSGCPSYISKIRWRCIKTCPF